MSTHIGHKHDCQDPLVYNPSGMGYDYYSVQHTCPDPSTLTDAKIAEMGLADLIRIRGQLKRDINSFNSDRILTRLTFGLISTYKSRAAISGVCRDKISLEIIENAIESRKQKSGGEGEISQLKLALMNLTLKVKELQKAIAL